MLQASVRQGALCLPICVIPFDFPSPLLYWPALQSALALFRLHNSSMKFSGHMIKARVIEVDKRKATLDAGAKIAKIAVSDITPECILERSADGSAGARAEGEVRPGDIVQVFLEHEETPEGDMLVSGQQAAVRRRVPAVWKELATRMETGKPVRGRVLNSVSGGFSVGVAGLVCFLPGSNCSRVTASRIGDLQEFRVVQMVAARNNVVLADVRLDAELRRASGRGFMRRDQKPSVPRMPRVMVAEAEGIKRELEQVSGGAARV